MVVGAAATQGANPNVQVNLHGVFKDGYVKFVDRVDVAYSGVMGGVPVDIAYTLKSEIKEEGNTIFGYLVNSPDGKTLFDGGRPISVSGSITRKGASKGVTDLSGLILPKDGNLLHGWLVSQSTQFPKLRLQSVTALPKPLKFADPEVHVDAGALVSLFGIQSDFTLKAINPQPLGK
jgi:hypothetical protein